MRFFKAKNWKKFKNFSRNLLIGGKNFIEVEKENMLNSEHVSSVIFGVLLFKMKNNTKITCQKSSLAWTQEKYGKIKISKISS